MTAPIRNRDRERHFVRIISDSQPTWGQAIQAKLATIDNTPDRDVELTAIVDAAITLGLRITSVFRAIDRDTIAKYQRDAAVKDVIEIGHRIADVVLSVENLHETLGIARQHEILKPTRHKIDQAAVLIAERLPRDGQWHDTRSIVNAATIAGIGERTVQRAAKLLDLERQRAREPHARMLWRWPTLPAAVASERPSLLEVA